MKYLIKALLNKFLNKKAPKFKKTKKNLYLLQDNYGDVFIPSLVRYSLYKKGIKERFDHFKLRYFFSKLDKNTLVIDVGSHIGEFPMCFNKIVGKIICFEPHPDTLVALRENTKSFTNIDIYPFALSKKSSIQKIYFSKDPADTSLFPPDKSIDIHEVNTYALDDVDLKIENFKTVVLKLEAEGYEEEVLEGSVKTLKKIKEVSIDVSPERDGKSTEEAVKRILKSLGFINIEINDDFILSASNPHI